MKAKKKPPNTREELYGNDGKRKREKKKKTYTHSDIKDNRSK